MPSAMDLMGLVAALSVKQSMGADVTEEAEAILKSCDTEEDKQTILRQFKTMGVPYPPP